MKDGTQATSNFPILEQNTYDDITPSKSMGKILSIYKLEL